MNLKIFISFILFIGHDFYFLTQDKCLSQFEEYISGWKYNSFKNAYEFGTRAHEINEGYPDCIYTLSMIDFRKVLGVPNMTSDSSLVYYILSNCDSNKINYSEGYDCTFYTIYFNEEDKYVSSKTTTLWCVN